MFEVRTLFPIGRLLLSLFSIDRLLLFLFPIGQLLQCNLKMRKSLKRLSSTLYGFMMHVNHNSSNNEDSSKSSNVSRKVRIMKTLSLLPNAFSRKYYGCADITNTESTCHLLSLHMHKRPVRSVAPMLRSLLWSLLWIRISNYLLQRIRIPKLL